MVLLLAVAHCKLLLTAACIQNHGDSATKLAQGFTMQSDLAEACTPSEAALTQGPCLRTSLGARSRVPGCDAGFGISPGLLQSCLYF